MFLWAFLLLVVAFVGAIVWFIGGYGYPKPSPAWPFDSALWKLAETGPETRYADRGRMIDSLTETHTLIGMTRAQVEGLLGPPEYASWRPVFPHPGYVITSGGTGLLYDYSAGLILLYDAADVLVGWTTPWKAAGVRARKFPW
jgi:hypothetical protein